MRRMLIALAVAAVLLVPLSARAVAAPIASLTAESPLSGGEGWLVWSVHKGSGWVLEGFHGGRLSTLRVPPRREPFDVSVGTDAHGAPVLTFTRCRVTPLPEDAGLYVKGTGTLVQPNTGAGCRVRLFELDNGRESTPAIPHPGGTSDTSPAMWRGTVAFARKAPGHGRTSQVMLWSPRRPRALVTLPHGAVPEGCPPQKGCGERPVGGEVQALSLDAHIVAFVWKPLGPEIGDGAWEDRVDSLAHRTGRLAGSPILTESCTGAGEEDLVEEEWPLPPLSSGTAALFGELERGGCYTVFGSALLRYDNGRRSVGHSSEPIVELARDGAVSYGLLAQKPHVEQEPGCSAALPCALEVVHTPALEPSHYQPTHPFDF